MLRAEVTARVHPITIEAGYESFRWGPGRRGTLLLSGSNNHAGTYYSQELDALYTLLEQDGNLVVRYPRGEIPLKQAGRDSFGGQFPIGTLRFSSDEDTRCKGFELDNGRVRKLRFSRVDLSSPAAGP